jgi:mono/diheme cytochrome c family protein
MRAAFCLFSIALLSAACRQDMHDQPKYKPLRPADSIGSINDGMSARPIVEGTVARGFLREDTEFYTGRLGQGGATSGAASGAGQPSAQAAGGASQTGNQAATQPSMQGGQQVSYQGYVTAFPMEINQQALDRGQERYNVYCSVCHGATGAGDGMIVRRGFRKPPSFHEARLQQAPAGYFFDVVTNGFGAMPDYAASISPEDRWKIAAYIRALQLSQGARFSDLPPALQQRVNNPPPQPSGAQTEGGHR